MDKVFSPGDAAKRLKELATTISTAPTEQIVVYRMTQAAAQQVAADLNAIAVGFETFVKGTEPA